MKTQPEIQNTLTSPQEHQEIFSQLQNQEVLEGLSPGDITGHFFNVPDD